MDPQIDPQIVFKNILIAALFLGLIALAALALRPGSVNTVGQGGGYSWGGGEGGDEGDDD